MNTHVMYCYIFYTCRLNFKVATVFCDMLPGSKKVTYEPLGWVDVGLVGGVGRVVRVGRIGGVGGRVGIRGVDTTGVGGGTIIIGKRGWRRVSR